MKTSPTLRLSAHNARDVEHAAALLRAGGTVAFPTETVYGLGADALRADAVEKVFVAKQRPAWDPLIVHIADSDLLATLAVLPAEIDDRVRALIGAFWPGPLTLLLPRTGAVPDAVTAGRDLVGVRLPQHPVALALLRAAGVAVAAPSANTFGHTSPTTAAHVLADLDGRIDAVLDGGATTVGVESTVLDPQRMVVYRPGAVTVEQIAAVTGVLPQMYRIAASTGDAMRSLPSPGVGIRHYAPRARLVLTAGSEGALRQAAAMHRATLAEPSQLGILLPAGWNAAFPEALVFGWADFADHDGLAASLFRGLRALDDRGVATILCPLPAGDGLALALRDRLEKAARPR